MWLGSGFRQGFGAATPDRELETMEQVQLLTKYSRKLWVALPLAILVIALPVVAAGSVHAADTLIATQDQTANWVERLIDGVENEAARDIETAPDVWSALGREWRSLDGDGSASGTLADLAWVALVAVVAIVAERAIVAGLGRRPRRRIDQRTYGPGAGNMALLIACDLAGLAMFVWLFMAAQRHLLPAIGITSTLGVVAASVLVRWRIAALIMRIILRPGDPAARLVDIPDTDARRLNRFLSIGILAVIMLIAVARLGLMDEDSGASHVVGLLVAVLVCTLYSVMLIRARRAGEALIRGHRVDGMVGTCRCGVARAWVPVGLVIIAGLFLSFVAGLSLGLLSYYRAVSSTLGVLFVVLVLDRLVDRVCFRDEAAFATGRAETQSLGALSMNRIVRVLIAVIGAVLLASIWIGTLEPSTTAKSLQMSSVDFAIATLLVAFVVWELIRLAIDRNLQGVPAGPGLPGADEEEEISTASRLQTVLPLLRAAAAVLIGIVAVLIVLSRLGVNTAPLMAGAGVFGLAVSFGSQSLVRDIISGLFYMWDDAFRVGEYIDTGRLKGTVEKLGVRSVRLRHQNGPLHTIPYGQLGAVTNLSRDFATIKFNLRFDPRTDIELVRRTTKQIGLAMMDENEEMATEVMAPLKLQGIAEVVDNALVLRFKFTARPVKPSWVQREYLKRMYAVFAEKGITFASGAMVLQTVSTPDLLPGAAPVSPAAADVPPVQGAVAAVASGAVPLG